MPRGFAVAASPRDDGYVRVADGRTGQSATLSPQSAGSTAHGWVRYPAVVVERLARNFPGAPLGADIAIVGDLPRAAGLSSSSALVVSIATALIRSGRLDDRPEWSEAIRSPLELAHYLGSIENGQSFRSLAGTTGVGTFGGSEDHTAILNCRPGQVSAFRFVPVHHLRDAPVPADWRFIVATSGIAASKAGGVRERYNRASLASRALVDLWNAAGHDPAATLAEALTAPGSPEEFSRIIARSTSSSFSRQDLGLRLAHFQAEDARVEPAAAAFADASREHLAQLAAASQDDAERLLGNQTPETASLAGLAGEAGAFAATSFGAGFGGSVWALAPAVDAGRIAATWMAAYRAAYPAAGASAETFVCASGPGLIDLSVT